MSSHFALIKRSFATATTKITIKNVTVIGAGLMGSGIAQVAAQTGHNVTLVDIESDILKKSENNIVTSLGRISKKLYKDKPADAEKFINEAKNRITPTLDAKTAVKDADLVVEAIVENMEEKQKLFKTLDEFAPQRTLFTTNTSSFGIGEMGSVTKRQDRFGGLHFFNPVPMMKLLEVVRSSETSDETYRAMMEWGKTMGKACITCKDTPGFVVNRLLIPYLAEAIRMYERGDASAEDIDTAMKLGAGYPMGPLELVDYVGHDTTYFALDGWHKRFPENSQFIPNETLQNNTKIGRVGRKSGEGFYKYNK